MKKILLLTVMLFGVCWAYAGNPGENTAVRKPALAQVGHVVQPCVVCADCDGIIYCAFAPNCALAQAQLQAMMKRDDCNAPLDTSTDK